MRVPHVSLPWTRLAALGVLVAALVGAAGVAFERVRFGANERETAARVERSVEAELAARAAELRRHVARLRAHPGLAAAMAPSQNAARALFGVLEETGLDRLTPNNALTVYSADAQVLAWSGRPSTLPTDRIAGTAALFVAPGPLGLRLVYLEPVLSLEPASRRVGSIAAERVLSTSADASPGALEDVLAASPVPVTLVPRYAQSGAQPALGGVVLRGQAGEPILEIRVDPDRIRDARARHRAATVASVAVVLAVTLLLLGAPLAEWRSARREYFLPGTLALLLLLAAARWLLWWALPAGWSGGQAVFATPRSNGIVASLLRSPVDFLLHAILLAGCVGLGVTVIERVRVAWRGRRGRPEANVRSWLQFVATQLAAGVVVAALVAGFEHLLQVVVQHANADVLQLSLSPFQPARLALLFGFVVLHAAVFWGAVLTFVAAGDQWGVCLASSPVRLLRLCCWLAPTGVFIALASYRGWELPQVPHVLTAAAAVAAALLWRRASPLMRRGSQAQRLVLTVVAMVVPSVVLYPSLEDVTVAAKHRLIAERYAREALSLPETLLARMNESLVQVDQIRGLPELVEAGTPDARVDTETAFAVWRRTALATYRLTSAVEIYNADARLVSRFALNLPEYEPRSQQYRSASCQWDVFGEAAPLGAEERRMLHAERGICDDRGRMVGALVLHVMLDYATLSFISSQNPYFELFRGRADDTRTGVSASDVNLVIYGWGRTPIYTTTGRAWPLDDALFQRLYRSRGGFWVVREIAGERSRVYLVNDRNGIYALGYPAPTWFSHSVRLAELVTLGAVAAILALLAASILQRIAWREPWSGRRLLREVRTSFSRKLFLAFVAATVIPVLILAFTIRAYVASRLRSDIEAEAARTAAVAQRVVEETLTLDRRGEVSPAALDDDALVWISRVINQDVNIFVGPQLSATSERDLYASGQLPTRMPDAVYRAIVIHRLPSYVGEDEIAGLEYLMAAAPVRAGNTDAVLTVPFTLRQREIEREIDDLDRGVLLGVLVFILLGAGIGYWLAERISDPVQRLTRASRRIAAGDLDTRVFVRSADELRRLVEAFNKMAWELQRQRAQLERTNRLEAWADMARQVAHDIKNPLTPIQLSAEHLQRVHRDRGEPLTPVLQACVDTILTQVRLLRQIAGEFSSFASTPVPRPVRTHLPELIEEVVGSYRTGLEGRVTFVLNLPDGLPPVDIDRTLVGRAFTNMVDNALHAMPAGGTLAISAAQSGDGVTVSVTDTGVGMDAEAIDRIFEPYFSTKATGTGLGLTIAKRNIELHGGSIRIASDKGRGTTVTFTLPVADAANDADGRARR